MASILSLYHLYSLSVSSLVLFFIFGHFLLLTQIVKSCVIIGFLCEVYLTLITAFIENWILYLGVVSLKASFFFNYVFTLDWISQKVLR